MTLKIIYIFTLNKKRRFSKPVHKARKVGSVKPTFFQVELSRVFSKIFFKNSGTRRFCELEKFKYSNSSENQQT